MMIYNNFVHLHNLKISRLKISWSDEYIDLLLYLLIIIYIILYSRSITKIFNLNKLVMKFLVINFQNNQNLKNTYIMLYSFNNFHILKGTL